MKPTKLITLLLVLCASFVMQSCDDDEPTPLNVELQALNASIDENPTNGDVIGMLNASADRGALRYAIISQTPSGAMAIEASTGELTVADATLFDFETNPTLTAEVRATVEGTSAEAKVTVTLNNVAEAVTADAFAITIDENPAISASLGSVMAATDAGTLSYALVSQNPEGAVAIDAATGELTVTDASLFDYEVRTMLTAIYRASNGVSNQENTITITLNNVFDVSVGTVPFITTWQTTTANQEVSFRITDLAGRVADYQVDWGDGTVENNISSHQYSTAGTYQVKIKGDVPYFSVLTATDDLLISIDQWGNQVWESFNRSFLNAANLEYKAADAPDLSRVESMHSMFSGCVKLNADLNTWDVGNVTDMGSLFNFCTTFNGNIANWNVSRVTNMKDMFKTARLFNQNLNSWNVGNVTTMNSMFERATTFNGAIGNWNTGKVTDMNAMFQNAEAFNQDISGWDVSQVTGMSAMFDVAINFNQDISAWDVGNVMFTSSMFAFASAFNQDISGWNTHKVTTMNRMFFGATAFNQDISTWDVSQVTDMESMFTSAAAFDQNLGSWNLSSMTNVNLSLSRSLSVANYDATLNGWANASTTPDGLSLNANGLTYSDAGKAGRDILTQNKGWTITGDSKQ